MGGAGLTMGATGKDGANGVIPDKLPDGTPTNGTGKNGLTGSVTIVQRRSSP
jgi:hypothetical protein